MSAPAIRCEGLSKRFSLGTRPTYGRLSETLTDLGRRAAGRLTGRENTAVPADRDLWALRDVSFDVQPGEVVGIIGRNGAGKSTLLKLLTRITPPTSGRATVRGRVGSLLEVGTGFHPELTGRENVYLNGAILGMSRREIARKFDEIVAFAEMERFLDTPVKRYSSGMTVRLAFAVAAHLEPEVLIIDEVLSVGDVEFQKKCLGKVGDASRHGRTVLIVSHNLPSISNLCSRAVMLEGGRIVRQGETGEIVAAYLARSRSAGGVVVYERPEVAPGGEAARLHSVRILQEGVEGPTADVDIAKEIVVEITYWILREAVSCFAAIWLRDCSGIDVLASAAAPGFTRTRDDWFGRSQPPGLYVSRCRLPPQFLNEGIFRVTPIVNRQPWENEVLVEDLVEFRGYDTGSMRELFTGTWLGVVRPQLDWRTERISEDQQTAK